MVINLKRKTEKDPNRHFTKVDLQSWDGGKGVLIANNREG